MQTLDFDNRFTAQLPADDNPAGTRRQVSNALYTRVQPTPVRAPYLIATASEVADLVGLSPSYLESDEFLATFAGNEPLPGMDPHATCYGGHQFGNWAGQLGDGRAINLGELAGPNGRHMLQLKGAGPTPFSRAADGLAVLRSSVREFLCSEAMHHLGVPTTRALSLIGTGEEVLRDMLYDGNAEMEPGAVVCRVSRSFVRFGHFQLLTARGEHELLRQFTDFVLSEYFPDLAPARGAADAARRDAYLAWFHHVCTTTAEMIVHWMRVGFVHGVMNTDNMSILGETIDYGPYGWLEDFDPDWTPNTTDAGQRRYRYGQQPAIGQWNLMQLANAILPLVGEPKPLEEALSAYARTYEQAWQAMMAAKLGLNTFDPSTVDGLMVLLTSAETDMTLFFRGLAEVDPHAPELSQTAEPDERHLAPLLAAHYPDPGASSASNAARLAQVKQQTAAWLAVYGKACAEQGVDEAQRGALMNQVNPLYVLRNYLAQLAIDEAHEGDFGQINTLLDVLRRPYEKQPGREAFAEKRPDWARTRVGGSMLSCSS